MSSFIRLKDELIKKIQNSFMGNPRFKKILIISVTFLLLALLMTINFLPNRIDLKVGEVSPRDIDAPKTTTFIDQIKTEERKRLAAESVPKVYEEDVSVLNEVLEQLQMFFAAVKEANQKRHVPDGEGPNDTPDGNELGLNKGNVNEGINENGELPEINGGENLENGQPLSMEEKVELVKKSIDFEIPKEILKIALKTPDEELNRVEIFCKETLIKYLKEGIRPAFLENVKSEVRKDIYASDLAEPQQILSYELVQRIIRPNLRMDEEETKKRQEEAMERVDPVTKTVRKGENIVREGKVVTEEDIQVLEALGLRRPQVNFAIVSGLILVAAIILLIYGFYLHYYHRKLIQDENLLILICLLTVFITGLAKVFTFLPFSHPGYLVPVASVSILLALLVDYEMAIVLNTGLALLVALVTQDGLSTMAVNMIGGFAGIFAVAKVNQRSDFVRAGLLVGLIVSISIFAFGMINNYLDMLEILKLTMLGIINGVLTAVLTNGLLPMLENFFGIISPVKLLELSNPNQPLLKKLLVEAPGTYHHSIIVGNLAEAAADEVGADSLLVRVGAYYHDIGKIKRPYFFSENQFAGDNPHEKISPVLSTLIIKTHIKEGVELAKHYRLPKPIVDIIQQHHGTSLISFFYEEARHDEKYKEVKEEEFRYEGPKPQTAEAALVMLADMVEAALRSRQFSLINQNKIELTVRELVHKKLEDGQLDESDLTLKDLDKIVNSFVKVLTGIFHKRVEYPEGVEDINVELDKGVLENGGQSAKTRKDINNRQNE